MNLVLLIQLITSLHLVSAVYEDVRCKCVCFIPPGPFNNSTETIRKVLVKPIPTDKCKCDYMTNTKLCPFCDCKFQVRTTTTIKIVVCSIIVVILVLTVYMLFLSLLEPLLSSRRLSRKLLLNLNSPQSQTQTETSNTTPELKSTSSRNPSWFGSTSSTNPILPSNDGTSLNTTVIWDRTRKNVEQLMDMDLNLKKSSTIGRVRHRTSKPGAAIDLSEQVTDTGCLHSGSVANTSASVTDVVSRVRDQQQRWKGNVEAQRTRVFSERSLLN